MGDLLGLVLGLSLLLWVGHSHRRLRPRGAPPPPREHGALPSVSVVRPLRGLQRCEHEHLREALRCDYPGELETLFVLDAEDDPAAPLLRRLIAEHHASGRPGVARLLFAGAPPPRRTGKLNAMVAGLAAARGQLVAFADSDTRASPHLLAGLVRTLLRAPRAAAAFAPVVVSGPPQTAADVAYALMLNGLYGPAAAHLARQRGGTLPFIMGQCMVLRREALAAVGGLPALEGELVDDMALGMRLCAAGYENRPGPEPLELVTEGLSLGGFWRLYLRWVAFSRSGLPTAGKGVSWARGLVFWLGLTAAVVAAWGGARWGAACLLLVPLATAASLNALHRRLGGAPVRLRHAWVSFALVLLAPLVYLRLWLRPEVEWRGRSYRLGRGARLTTPAGTAPARPPAWPRWARPR